MPALLLWGPRDPVFSDRYLRDLLARLPHAEVHRYAGAAPPGHRGRAETAERRLALGGRPPRLAAGRADQPDPAERHRPCGRGSPPAPGDPAAGRGRAARRGRTGACRFAGWTQRVGTLAAGLAATGVRAGRPGRAARAARAAT